MAKLAPNTGKKEAISEEEQGIEDESLEKSDQFANKISQTENIAPVAAVIQGDNQVVFTGEVSEEFQAPMSEDVALLKDVPAIPKVPFEYNNRTAESYSRQGFKVPSQLGVDSQETQFLSKIRPNEWDKIQRTITRMVRVLAIDYSDPKLARREFVYWFENWYLPFDADNPRPEEVAPVTDHIEGFYEEQDKKPLPPVNGRAVGYKRSGSHTVYYIKFDKDKLDEIISKSMGTDADNIVFVVKNGPVRNDKFTYEQFKNLPFQKCMELIRVPGGPEMRPYMPTA